MSLVGRPLPVTNGRFQEPNSTDSFPAMNPKSDTLTLSFGDETGCDAICDDSGKVVVPASLTCSLSEVFQGVRTGERIFFGDGKIGGLLGHVAAERLEIDITQVVGGKARLSEEKGINLPDSHLDLPALSAKDLQDLEVAVYHADLLAVSFVQRPEDIKQLTVGARRLTPAGLPSLPSGPGAS